MSLIPEFEIGLWNGWILSAIFVIHNFLIMFIAPKKNIKEMMDQMKQAKGKDKLVPRLSQTMYYIIMIYAIFMPLKLKTPWLSVGLAVYLSGFILLILAEIQLFYRKPGEPIAKGFYSISRNPQYVMMHITWIGIGIATASWVIFALIVISVIVVHFMILLEEKLCLEKYGNVYREYTNKTRRYVGKLK